MSVEAALLLPCALTLLALLVQPGCVLYTRAVMASTASELARVMATSEGSDEDARAYALRRLRAVPALAVFHEGGEEGWEIDLAGPGESGRVSVSLSTEVTPLPFIGAAVWAMGASDGAGVRIEVGVVEDVRSSWIGGDYEDWVGIWG